MLMSNVVQNKNKKRKWFIKLLCLNKVTNRNSRKNSYFTGCINEFFTCLTSIFLKNHLTFAIIVFCNRHDFIIFFLIYYVYQLIEFRIRINQKIVVNIKNNLKKKIEALY